MPWQRSHRADPRANRLAKRHYSCGSPDSAQFVPPGRCLVLVTPDVDAVWVTSAPYPKYVKHAWPGAWVDSLFRREPDCPYLASELIIRAVAATRWAWPAVPPLGIVTFVDAGKVRSTNPGYCYARAGWTRLKETTKGELIVYQLLPADMPEAQPPIGAQYAMEGLWTA